MIYKFSHYTAFDDVDGDEGIENGHVQVCVNVDIDTADGGSGTVTIEGVTQDPDNPDNTTTVSYEYSIMEV